MFTYQSRVTNDFQLSYSRKRGRDPIESRYVPPFTLSRVSAVSSSPDKSFRRTSSKDPRVGHLCPTPPRSTPERTRSRSSVFSGGSRNADDVPVDGLSLPTSSRALRGVHGEIPQTRYRTPVALGGCPLRVPSMEITDVYLTRCVSTVTSRLRPPSDRLTFPV